MDFATRFDPKETEPRIYTMWEDRKLFIADAASRREPFTIVIPPPNVTGVLHLGHALNNTLQDILTRWKRMDGFEALYLPGTDHAGIATQVVVEKQLKKEEGRTREQLGRGEFLKRVWAWKEKSGHTILYQLKRLGCSCDWSRTRFTMDDTYSRAIRVVFVSLFKKGYIYRGLRIVNWCPRDQTALSDEEVVVPKPPPTGSLWHIKYPVKDEPGRFVTVATTRPETMLGDTGVAVHPKDPRYTALAGRTVILPLMDREIPVVADDFVESGFGTGAVKVTPAHDENDFECGKRHGLKAVAVIGLDGRMTKDAGAFAGLDRFEAREKVVAALRERGLLEKVEPHATPVRLCSRCENVIEPFLSEQWFVRMKELAAPAIAAVRRGDVKFRPERWAQVYLDWMENIRDWCVSRQIWWGHRIPVWYCACGETVASVDDLRQCPKCGGRELRQEEDVLDTWFSSALWPFATLGWPEETEDLEKFYPTQVLVTGRDIINLWVARMIMSGLEFRGEVPFSDVVINATILADDGTRMSKGKGNGVDPIDLIDTYGADALRFALTGLATGTQDFRFGRQYSARRTEEARNFVTKLWNAARFVATQSAGAAAGVPKDGLTLEDRWILSRLHTTIDEVTNGLESFEFAEAAQAIYRFTWWDFCDWYIELTKARKDDAARRVLLHVVETVLKLLHPIAPFVTEELWQRLGDGKRGSLMREAWPEAESARRDAALERQMTLVQDVVKAARDVRKRYDIANSVALALKASAKDESSAKALRAGAETIKHLANLSTFDPGVGVEKPKRWASVMAGDVTVHFDVVGKFDPAKERARTEKQVAELRGQAEQIQGQLGNEKFRAAKPEMAAQLEDKLASLRGQIRELEEHLKELGE